MAEIGFEWLDGDDAEMLSEFAAPLVRDTYPYVDTELVERFIDENLSPDNIRRFMSEGQRYAYVVSEDVKTGFIAYSLDEGTFAIDKLYLGKESRGKGIGTKTMEALLEMAKTEKCGTVKLVVNEMNTVAVRLYTKMGFVSTGYAKEYYAPSLRMVKDIRNMYIRFLRIVIKSNTPRNTLIIQNSSHNNRCYD